MVHAVLDIVDHTHDPLAEPVRHNELEASYYLRIVYENEKYVDKGQEKRQHIHKNTYRLLKYRGSAAHKRL